MKRKTTNTIEKIIADHSDINFSASNVFMWSPKTQTVSFDSKNVDSDQGAWSLLHELGHAILAHHRYHDDLELLIMEVAAWKKAKELAAEYGLSIAEDHIESCIDSYRQWLHKRSRCIECATHSLQINDTTYQCHNCLTKWRVPLSRFCNTRRTRVA